jgi:hypothetical protein
MRAEKGGELFLTWGEMKAEDEEGLAALSREEREGQQWDVFLPLIR